MCVRSRNFRTSGVLLHIEYDWFKQLSTKQAFISLLQEVFLREYSVASQDIGSSASNISVQTLEGKIRGGCVAIFDETYGSLRLTEKLYLEFDHLLARLSAALEANPGDGGNDLEGIVLKIRDEISSFSGKTPESEDIQLTPTGYEQVFTVGSRVCYRQAGQMTIDVEVIQPTMMNGNLMYQVKVSTQPGQQPAKRWVAASSIEPSANADAWEYAWWNRETEAYEKRLNNEG